MKNIVFPYCNQTIFGGEKKKKKKEFLRQSLDWRDRRKVMVKWLRIPLEHIQSGVFVLLFTLSPNLWYRSTFNRGSDCRDQEHFSLSFIALSNMYICICVFYKAWLFHRATFEKNVALCHWPSLCKEKLIEKQNTEEDVSENTSSPSEATSTLHFVNFPTTAASYLSY